MGNSLRKPSSIHVTPCMVTVQPALNTNVTVFNTVSNGTKYDSLFHLGKPIPNQLHDIETIEIKGDDKRFLVYSIISHY